MATESASSFRMGECVERPVMWNGEGLPPVGVACEVENDVSGGWDQVDSVLAYSKVKGSDVAVFQRGDMIAYAHKGKFRPIRTPEQIATEQRDREVDEMIAIIGDVGDNPSWPDIAAELHAAGYRKQADEKQ